MHPNYSNLLLDLKDVFIKKILHLDSSLKIFLETKPKPHTCPCCGNNTVKIHDYRFQTIKDLPFQLKHAYLVLKKRRYVCSCGKRFLESYYFLPRYHRRTTRLSFQVIELLRQTSSLKQVARSSNLSVSTVCRILDTLSYEPTSLPSCLCIDEFRGNAETGKFQCILVDFKKHQILDILPNRSQVQLTAYFRQYSRTERAKVKFFICDMWMPYVDLARIFFPNAKIIIDKYHFIRQMTWAIEAVRKRLQKTMPVSLRKYYKRSRSLILAPYSKLKREQKQACDLMLLYNDDLRLAHQLKEWFYHICNTKQYGIQRKDFDDWISNARGSGIKEFEACARTYCNWRKEILNAFKYGYTNGVTEGFNNKIKVLKRLSYGIKNFKRFRTRILHTTN